MRKKCVIYDLDGTVLDTEEMNFIPLQRLIKEELEKEIEYEELLKYKANAGLKTIEELGFIDIENSYKKWVRYVNEYEKGAKLYENFDKVIEEVSKMGIIQGIASSKMRKQYEIDFYDTGLHKYMECEVLAEDTEKHKPHPEPILKALEILNIHPSEALYVGDTESDMLASKEAEVEFALAKWGCVDVDKVKADYYLDSPEDLLKILK